MKLTNLITKKRLAITMLILIGTGNSSASEMTTLKQAPYTVCFTPGENCTQLIVDKIDAAKESIFVQAYSFTSAPIAIALVNAHNRKVAINVILDKSQIKNNQYSSAKFLVNEGIETYIDFKPAIAHNKVIIIDGHKVITGSFNFTKAAQLHNAENLIIIDDEELAKRYLANWYNRMSYSVLASEYSAATKSRHVHKRVLYG